VSLPADLRERPLELSDAPALAALARACEESYLDWAPAGWSVPQAPPGWAERFVGPGRWAHVAVDGGGRLVGSVAFRQAHADAAPGPPSGPLLAGVAHVGIVFVHPSRWREGIAGALLASAEAEMRLRGYVSEQLWTPEGAPAERFYAARGWERDGRRAWHSWVGLTVVGYARDLATSPPATAA
jgi:GNAT superfamily N-acetyltransferase